MTMDRTRQEIEAGEHVYRDAGLYQPVFGRGEGTVYAVYEAKLKIRNRLLGGKPKDPRLVKTWLMKTSGVTDEDEINHRALMSIMQQNPGAEEFLGVKLEDVPNLPAPVKREKLEEAVEAYAEGKGSGFLVDENGIYMPSASVKSMIKEAIGVLYPQEKWGPTRKGTKGYTAERIFVEPDRVYIKLPQEHRTLKEPEGLHEIVGHPSGPQGKKSVISIYEYVEEPVLEFEVWVTEDSIPAEKWNEIWPQAQKNGLGAARSQGFGLFDVFDWQLKTPYTGSKPSGMMDGTTRGKKK